MKTDEQVEEMVKAAKTSTVIEIFKRLYLLPWLMLTIILIGLTIYYFRHQTQTVVFNPPQGTNSLKTAITALEERLLNSVNRLNETTSNALMVVNQNSQRLSNLENSGKVGILRSLNTGSVHGTNVNNNLEYYLGEALLGYYSKRTKEIAIIGNKEELTIQIRFDKLDINSNIFILKEP
jgi:molybdenum-dependent DNA-binding transcriptional regulator ModE